jgi:hypothetical protein
LRPRRHLLAAAVPYVPSRDVPHVRAYLMTIGQESSPHVSYLSYATPAGSSFAATIVAVMLVGGVVGVVGSALAHGPWWFYLLFLCLVSYIGYGLCYHRAYPLRVNDGVLSWSGFRYHGSRAISDVEAVTVRSNRFANGSIYVWKFRDGTAVNMVAFPTLSRGRSLATTFFENLRQEYPNLSLPG